jgi:hypothetical protein
MKKLINLLFVTLSICAMDAPTEKLVEEIKKGNDDQLKSYAAHCLSHNTTDNSLLVQANRYREEQNPRVVELQKLINAPIEALKKANPKENLQKAVAAILEARQQIWWREALPIAHRFCLTQQHKSVLRQLQTGDIPLLSNHLFNYFRDANMNAHQIKEVIEEFKKIYPTITESLQTQLADRLKNITNPEVLVGMISADVVDERILFVWLHLDLRMGKAFIERQPTAARTHDLVGHCLSIDELIQQEQHHILKEKYPRFSEAEFQQEKEHLQWRIRLKIEDLRALRQTTYRCLQQTEGDTLPLSERFYEYIRHAVLVASLQKINQIEWFLDKPEFSPQWRSPNGTTALDLIISRHIAGDHEHTLEYVKLLRSAEATYSSAHQAKLEDLVKRKGKSDQRFDGLVTEQERAESQASPEYRRSLELLNTLYPDNALSRAKFEELV